MAENDHFSWQDLCHSPHASGCRIRLSSVFAQVAHARPVVSASKPNILPVVVGWAAIVAPVLHSITDAMEWFQGGFSPVQFWLNTLPSFPCRGCYRASTRSARKNWVHPRWSERSCMGLRSRTWRTLRFMHCRRRRRTTRYCGSSSGLRMRPRQGSLTLRCRSPLGPGPQGSARSSPYFDFAAAGSAAAGTGKPRLRISASMPASRPRNAR